MSTIMHHIKPNGGSQQAQNDPKRKRNPKIGPEVEYRYVGGKKGCEEHARFGVESKVSLGRLLVLFEILVYALGQDLKERLSGSVRGKTWCFKCGR